jgi:tetratricopeptide (TPR) repeat protein
MVQLCFLTLSYWLVGMADDYYYVSKAPAWCDLRGYSQAIRCFQKALRESEMAFVRASMAWCYAELGMTEQALAHYRAAYQRNKHPQIAVPLAWAAAP